MGKKNKNIYNKITEFQNLWLASRKARRGKRQKNEVLEFEYNLEENLFHIKEQLENESYNFGKYYHFTIKEPRDREIYAAPYTDRVVHHALCNIIEPILDKAMIYDTYACRIGKGTHKAINRAQNFLRSNNWVLKMDIKKYFFTIDHQILLKDISKKILDVKVLNLIQKILATYTSSSEYYYQFSDDTLFDYGRNRGLPIGNLTSQLFANYFLNKMDRFIKQALKFKHYIRYMDDFLIFSKDKDRLKNAFDELKNFCNSIRLRLHNTKCQIFPYTNGIKFLGFHIYRCRKRILRENLIRFRNRFRKRCRDYLNKDIAWENLLMSLNGWLGYAGKEENKKIINKILDNIEFLKPDFNIRAKFVC